MVKIAERLNEAIAFHNAGHLDRAEAIYRQLAVAAPRNAAVVYLRGQLAEEQGRTTDAIRLYQNAWQLDSSLPSSVVRLAGVLAGGGNAAEAETMLLQALARSPRTAELWNALGVVLKIRGRLEDALASFQKALELKPGLVDAWGQIGVTLGAAGRNFDALPFYDQALKIDPKAVPIQFGRAQSLHKTYQLDEAIAGFDQVLQRLPGHLEARSQRLFALQNLETMSREQLFAEHCAYGQAAGAAPDSLPGYDYAPDRRLRVAILSADLRTHSCAYFLEPLLQNLDREQFELFLYHDHFVEDAVSLRLRGLAKVWRNFVGQSHAAVERTIRADRPDILIDLSGHVANTVRLPILAHRLAPVQITYLGYPDTTGVAAMDFRLTDGIADPAGEADRFATEKLVRFSSVAWTYRPPGDAPAISLPAVTEDRPLTFGCFNSPTKFSAGTFSAWAELLGALPGARLLLKGRDLTAAPVRERLLQRMGDQGIPIERVDLLARTHGTVEHLAQYGGVDVALDTFPYHGTTTTCEALWMGRPVVTLVGDRHASRVGASLLTAIGRSEWIAQTPADYIRIARELALDRAARLQFALEARPTMARSALLDFSGQGQRFAVALRECWRSKVATITSPSRSIAA